MKFRYPLAILYISALLFATRSSAQMVGDCVFLKGKFVEIGIAPNGGYGSTLPAPAGYHPRLDVVTSLYDPGSASTTPSAGLLGFVADYGADGWTVGTPGYYGDYYLPGNPQEGWSIQVGTQLADAYIPSYLATGSTGFANSGGATLAGTNLAYVNSGGISKGVWTGTQGALGIRQTTVLDTNKLYFVVNVVLVNTGTTPLSDIYYLRTVDPDNDETLIGTPGFTTNNEITYQLPELNNRVLVSATGTSSANAYIGLGTKDCRAKCTIFDFGLAPSYTLQNIYNETTSYLYPQGATSTADVGIGLVFNVGTIPPGDSTTFSYAYILNSTYIDSALNSLQPALIVNDTVKSSSTTDYSLNICDYPAGSATIGFDNGGFYSWSWSPSTYLSSNTGSPVTVHTDSIMTDITYTVTGTGPSCETLTYHITFEHGTFPGPLTSPVSYCKDEFATPLTATGTNLSWFTSPTGGIGSPVAPTPSTAVPGTTTFYVGQSFDLCVSERSPLAVTVKPLPAPPYIMGTNPYCFSQTATPLVSTGTGVLWYSSPAGGIGVTTPPTVFTGAAGTFTFYASQTVDGCEGPRSAFATTVLPNITPAFTYNKHYGCHGDTVKFINGSVNATKYTWAFGDGSSDTATNPSHIYLTQGNYTVKLYSINDAGCSDSIMQTVELVHPLHAAFTASRAIICQHDSIAFTNASFGTDTTYTWYFGNGDTTAFSNPVHTFNNSGVYTVQLVAKDFVPCYDTASMVVYIDTISGIRIDLTDSVLCAGTYVTITGQYASVGNTGVTWAFGGADSIRDVNPLNHAFGAGTYVVMATAHYRACQDTATTRTLTVIPQPTIDLGRDTSICKGSESLQLKDIGGNDNSGANYVWSTGEHSSAITVVAPGTYYVTKNVNNCYAADSIVVANDCYMNIPNVFTPNGDGINEYFYPRSLLAKGLTTFKMNIYNRWGQLIFETSSLEGSGWDGRLNNVDQPVGVYVYIIDATFRDGQKEHHQGNVTLMR